MNIIYKEVVEAWFKYCNVTINRLDIRRNHFRSCFGIFNGKTLIQHSVIIDNIAAGVEKLVNFQEKSDFSAFEFKELDKGLEMSTLHLLITLMKAPFSPLNCSGVF